MELQTAKKLADSLVSQLSPYCEKIQIGGSIRRGKPEVKDIEICCIVKKIKGEPIDIFSEGEEVIHPEFIKIVNGWEKIKGEPTGKYTARKITMQGVLGAVIQLDLFMANKDNYGCIELIRTGDWEFSKHFMGAVIRQGGYMQDGGYLKKLDGTIIPMASEQELFAFFKIPYIEPKDRNLTNLKKFLTC